MTDETRPEGPSADPPEPCDGLSSQAPREPETPDERPRPYVFRIVPADPKNAFDFEDVADK